MANNNSETVVSRTKADEDLFRSETRFTAPSPARKIDALGDALVMNGSRKSVCGAPAARATTPRNEFHDLIGKELRHMYEDVVSQPVPERFLLLLKGLESGVAKSADALPNDALQDEE